MSRSARLRSYYETNETAIKVGSLTNALIYVPAIALVVPVFFGGAIGGWLAGSRTPRYGPTVRNGAVAGALGPAILIVIAAVIGVFVWAFSGPPFVLEIARRLVVSAPIFVPLFTIQGAIGGLAVTWFARMGKW
ncbi:MAG: DUF5518 domain-containing protein [Halapricum sp.]